MKIVKGFILWLLASVALYFCSVLVLFIMTSVVHTVFENIWVSAVPVLILGEIIMLCCWIYNRKKLKMLRNNFSFIGE